MTIFKDIRLQALEKWNTGLTRNREIGEFSDDYSNSKWCRIQGECTENGIHCSFICSLNDWLNNISDLLHDNRYDELSAEENDVMFRFYTRILLLISEVIEDFVMLNKQILNLKGKNDASRDLESGTFANNELKELSEFINSVCKHKTENNNLHVHNHHLTIEFVDFGINEHENQIRLGKQDWKIMNKDTTILIPKLNYFIDVIIKTNNKVLTYIDEDINYKDKLLDIFADKWTTELND